MNTNARREFLGLTSKGATMGTATGFVAAADTADMVMRPEENSLKELETLQKIVSFAPFREIKALHPFDLNAYYSALAEKSFATSYGMGWKELQAVRVESPGGEFSAVITPSTHMLVLSVRPPEKMDLPCEIEWEYDFPENAFYANNRAVPWIIPLESAHTITLLLCVIRCDVMFGGNSRFRILGSETVFSECNFRTGDRFTGNIKIRPFARIQDRLLIYADYRGLNNGNPAFHSQLQLCLVPANEANPSAPSNRRVEPRPQEKKSQTTISKPKPICSKRSFSKEEIESLKRGDLAACFGLVSEKRRPGALSAPQLSLIDEVLRVEPEGGPDGLGEILAEKEIDASHWVFPLHFKNDPVLPGVLYCEGCYQTLKFYAYFCGLHRSFADIDFVCLSNESTKTRFLGEVRPKRGTLQFSVSILSYSEGTEPALRLEYNISMNITSTEDQGTYANYVNSIRVKLLDALGMNVRYTHRRGSELYTVDGRTILDCLSGHCVHNVGHNHPFVVAALVAELQSQSPSMLQSNVVKEAGTLAQVLCENAGGKVSKVFFCSSGSEGVEAVIKFARAHTGRTDLVYATGAFHGLTCGALSLMGSDF
jgi:3-hydroxymyristoyl/3-hydroxydecanoyl-(acyl carrier protein) dehydratase